MLAVSALLYALVSSVPRMDSVPAVSHWTVQELPGGEPATVLATDSRMPATLYAGGSGVFRSDDYGSTWIMLNIMLRPTRLSVDPSTDDRLYALSGGHLWASRDEGVNWVRTNDPPGLGTNFLVDAAGALYADGSEGVFKSSDGGQDWSAASSGPPRTATLAAQDASRAGVLYAIGPANAAFGGSVYETVDGAISWNGPIFTTSLDMSVTAVAASSVSPKTVYVSTHIDKVSTALVAAIVYARQDQGTIWEPIFSAQQVGAITCDPVLPSTLYAAALDESYIPTVVRIALPTTEDPRRPPIGRRGFGAQSLTVAPDGRALYAIGTQGDIGTLRLDIPERTSRTVNAR